MSKEKYKIEVSEDCVEIMGTLTIREAFDFLNFFEREGYTTLEDWGERTTLYMRKRDLDQERKDEIIKNSVENNGFYQEQYSSEKIQNEQLRKKISELESLIRGIMVEESDKVKSLKQKITKLEQYNALLNLKNSPEAAEICKMEGPEGEDHSPFAGSLE